MPPSLGKVPRCQRRISLLVLRLVDGCVSSIPDLNLGDFRGYAVSEILRSWKEIATYADASVRTVQRWERDFGFPIRRLKTKKGAVVFAFKADLHSWLEAKTENEQAIVRDNHFRAMFLNSILPTFVLSDRRVILDANSAAIALIGAKKEDLISKRLDWIAHKASTDYNDREWQTFLKVGTTFGLRNGRRNDGSIFAAEYVLRTFAPGLHVLMLLAIVPGGVPRKEVYYRVGRGKFSI